MVSILDWLTRIRMLLGCALCACVVYWLIWLLHSPDPWEPEILFLVFGLWCFSPLLVLTWALLPGSGDHARAYVAVRYAIALHIILTLFLAIPFGIEWAAMGITGILIDLAVIGLGPWRTDDHAPLRFYRKGHLIFSGGVVVCLMTWSYMNVVVVAWKAERIAAGKPYCLQIPSTRSSDYKETTSLHDLRGLTMQAWYWKDITVNFHAVLVVENGSGFSWYNWSYRKVRFTPLVRKDLESAVIGMREPSCELEPHFVQALPFFTF
ncbi:hypothetical protein [Microvirga makkahensis]|uniref:Uncharacterized protein n=1 Tax=Microvirga makkahensis TaxID=1128670 RepID=A0A7X3MX94_9HYPH|nr:hypothetical protein [Microvirga makkahensis]MXQ14911.1 hypothetical protein [Microvirga makkahensis]